MIVSKGNLSIVNMTTVDKNIPVLNCLHLRKDGGSVAGNGKSFIASSPVPDKTKSLLKAIFEDSSVNEDFSIRSETIRDILKNIESDRKFGGKLENSEVTIGKNKEAVFEIFDGATRRSIKGRIVNTTYAPYLKLFKRIYKERKNVRLVVNLKRFLSMLTNIQKATGDTSDFSPAYIEFTEKNDIILRMRNPKTDQRFCSTMKSYNDNEAPWMELSDWEKKELFQVDSIDSSDKPKKVKRVGGLNESRIHNLNNDTVGNFSNNTNDDSDFSGNADDDAQCFKKHVSKVKKIKGGKKVNEIGSVGLGEKVHKGKLRGFIINKKCKCGNFHLASNGSMEWCSGKDGGCGYVISKG